VIPRQVGEQVLALDPAGVPYLAEIELVEIFEDEDDGFAGWVNAPDPGEHYPQNMIVYLLRSLEGRTAMDEYAGDVHLVGTSWDEWPGERPSR